MNLEKLQVFNSTDGFSIIIYDIANVFILPFICLFGIITSIINVIVMIKSKLNNYLNKYLFLKSFCDLTFLITQCFTFIIRCGRWCSYSYSYISKCYDAYIYRYFGYVLINFCCFLDISVSIDRIFSFKTTSRYNKFKIPFKIRCVVLLILSTLVCIPQYALFRIPEAVGKLKIYDSKKNFTRYEVLYLLKNQKNEDLKIFVSVLRYVRGYGSYGFLTFLNIIIVYKLKLHLSKKKSMTNILNKNLKSQKTESKTTLMILVICINYLIGNMLDSLSLSIYIENNILLLNLVNMISNSLLYISHSLHLFIYLFLHKNFEKILFHDKQ